MPLGSSHEGMPSEGLGSYSFIAEVPPARMEWIRVSVSLPARRMTVPTFPGPRRDLYQDMYEK